MALLVAAFGASRLPAQAPSTDGVSIVRQASRKYQALSSFQAAFRQVRADKYDEPETTRGTLYQEGKNRFALRWSDPAKEAIVLDGTFFWIYTPSTSPGQVLRYAQQNQPTYGGDLIGTFLDNPEARYRISYVSSEVIDGHQTDAVLMEPIAKDPNFLRATLWLDRQSGMPRRIEVQEKREAKRTLYLASLLQNPSIPPSVFKFDTKGLKVIPQ